MPVRRLAPAFLAALAASTAAVAETPAQASAPAPAQAPAPPAAPPTDPAAPAAVDWRAAALRDLEAIAAVQADSHPGFVDDANPGFLPAHEAALARARADAAQVRSREDWWAVLRAYIAGYDDGHVSIGLTQAAPLARDPAWPGFLTGYVDGEHRVAVREEEAAPPLGARLLSCDGVPADQLAAERVGRYRGSWSLEARRVRWGPQLLLDWGHRFSTPPAACVFEADGESRAYVLAWRTAALAELTPKLIAAAQGFQAPIEMRRLADGTVWISMGSFANSGETATKLGALMAAVKADLPAVRSAPRIVLDVRGNGGGSSHWSQELAAMLWGEDWVNARMPDGGQVDWRVSDANIAHMEALAEEIAAQTPPSEGMMAWARAAVAGMKAARDQGLRLWRQPRDEAAPTLGRTATTDLEPPVFVVADGACASACLNAMDIWLAAGAVHAGRETGADTTYMEIRTETTPSGWASFSIPVKVYRGAARGHMQTYRPRHPYPGDMADTAGLERWIAGLPRP